MQLGNKISAIVTGGASGLGEATVRFLANAGVKVAIFDMNSERGEAVAKDVNGIYCQVDITQDDQINEAFERARKAHGQERILVNCAGIATAIKTVGRDKNTREIKPYPLDQFNKVIQVNLIGTFRCIAKSSAGMLTLNDMVDDERGVIVNTASVAAQDGQIGQAAYTASKAGIVGMTLPIARDLMNEGIRVNTILPGLFRTPLLETGLPQVVAALESQVPFPKRLGNPKEYAELVGHIISNQYLNAECIRLDGAIRMTPK
jgi:NAD(P)-dependent dehydrogenase (short-subunit alcohol dehydrogenase family)